MVPCPNSNLLRPPPPVKAKPGPKGKQCVAERKAMVSSGVIGLSAAIANLKLSPSQKSMQQRRSGRSKQKDGDENEAKKKNAKTDAQKGGKRKQAKGDAKKLDKAVDEHMEDMEGEEEELLCDDELCENEVLDSDEEINSKDRKKPMNVNKAKQGRKPNAAKVKTVKAKSKPEPKKKLAESAGGEEKKKRPFHAKDSFLHKQWIEFRDAKLPGLRATMTYREAMKKLGEQWFPQHHLTASCLFARPPLSMFTPTQVEAAPGSSRGHEGHVRDRTEEATLELSQLHHEHHHQHHLRS